MTEPDQSSSSAVSDETVAADGTGVETGTQRATVATDSRTNERLVKAVGTFVVVGIGFVFSLFLVDQFAGGGGGGIGGGLLGSNGPAAGFGLAVVLSPLIAVLVGTDIGRDGEGDAVVDAGIASAVGFVVMFFVTMVLAASLSGGATGGAAQAGPLVGLAVGVAITGAASAAVAGWQQDFLDAVSNPPLVKSIVFGSLTYVVFAVGYAIAMILANALASGGGGFGAIGLGGGAMGSLAIALLLAPLLAVCVGLFAGRDGLDTPGAAAISGGLGAAVGTLLLIVLTLITIAILQPSGGSIPIPVGPIVGLVVGAGLTGTGAGYVGGR